MEDWDVVVTDSSEDDELGDLSGGDDDQ